MFLRLIVFLEGRATDVFEPTKKELVFLNEVDCKGTEKNLTLCTSNEVKCDNQNSTGVICGKSSGTVNHKSRVAIIKTA